MGTAKKSGLRALFPVAERVGLLPNKKYDVKSKDAGKSDSGFRLELNCCARMACSENE